MPGTPFYLLPHVVVHFHVKDIGDKVESMLVVVYFGVQPGKVESVGQVIFVDLTEVLVAF